MNDTMSRRQALAASAALLAAPASSWGRAAEPLQVCATVPELGSLAREIGGDQVAVTVFTKGTEDPHYVEAKPSFVKRLSTAEVLVTVGMDLEVGYLPVLVGNARNPRILPGAPGRVDASAAVTPLEIPSGTLDRSMGDVHPQGNPHYLLDPVRGLQVAALLRDRFSALRPGAAEGFRGRHDAFRERVGRAMLGDALFEKHPAEFEKLALLHEKGALAAFLAKDAPGQKPGGWIGALASAHGAKIVADHNLWPYFASRFGLQVLAFLEPKPGVTPTTKHLLAVTGIVKANGVRVILSSPFIDPCHARTVADATGAVVAPMAHQAGAREKTDEYLPFIEYNVRTLAAALAAR